MRKGWSIAIAVAVAFMSFVVASPSLACEDGTTKINQSKAITGGAAPGDIKGFPVTISTSGSYCLTSNLDLTGWSLNTRAIEVVGSNLEVTINLNGFSIRGPYVCCAAVAGGAEGVLSPEDSRVALSNGFIEGMAQAGANVGNGSVRDLQVVGSGSGLIVLFGNTENVVVRNNRGNGLDVHEGNVARVVALENGENGIQVFRGNVRDSFSARNGTDGIDIQQGTLSGSYTVENAQTVTGAAFRCNGDCAYSQNNFDGCVIGGGPEECIVGNAIQVPTGSNVCNGAVCP